MNGTDAGAARLQDGRDSRNSHEIAIVYR